MLRVVVDTNLWISFLIGRKLSVLKELFTRGDLQLLSSYEQLAELGDVASRFKFRKYFSEAQAEELLNLLYASSELVEVREHIHACRDEDDDYLLEIAVNGRADILVTGDADLLVLHPFRGIEILSHSDFKQPRQPVLALIPAPASARLASLKPGGYTRSRGIRYAS